MKMKYSIFLTAILVSLLSAFITIDEDWTKNLIADFNNYISTHPQEKFYLHIAKVDYYPGENVWFKVYQFDAYRNRLQSLSQTVRIQLISTEADSIINEYPVRTKAGTGHGAFELPEDLPAGTYVLRTYSNWMLNFEHEFAYDKAIYVYRGGSTAEQMNDKPEPLQADNIHFFPEGGNYLYGVNTRMAFKVVNASGQGVDVSGELIDEKGNLKQKFSSLKYGMGSLFLNHKKGEKLRARFFTSDSATMVEKEIPSPNNSGYQMSVINSTRFIRTTVYASSDKLSDSTLLVLTAGGEVRFSAKSRVANKPSIITFEKAGLPPGLAVLTLFELSSLKPVNERLLFIRPTDSPDIEIALDETGVTPRKKLTVALNLVRGTGSGSIGSVNVSRKTDVDLGDNLSSYLLLSSELRGNIQNPSYYFDKGNKDANQAIDNLLLTQGWRRYRWDDLNGSDSDLTNLLEREGFFIQGRVEFGDNRMVAGDHEVNISSNVNNDYFGRTLLDKNGLFIFYNMDFDHSREMLFTLNDTLNNYGTFDVTVDFPRLEKSTAHFQRNQMSNHGITNWGNIQRHYDLRGTKNSANMDTKPFYGEPDRVVKLEEFLNLPTINEVFRELLTGVRLRDRNGSPEIRVMEVSEDVSDRSRRKFYSNKPPLLFVNNARVYDPTILTNMEPTEIDRYEIVYSRNRKYAFIDLEEGEQDFSGLLSVYTKNGFNRSQLELKYLDIAGFSAYKEYYSPNYDDSQSSRIPDFRDLLYWNPEVEFDSTGHFRFETFSSDLSGEYEITVEGITGDGQPFSKSRVFNVMD